MYEHGGHVVIARSRHCVYYERVIRLQPNNNVLYPGVWLWTYEMWASRPREIRDEFATRGMGPSPVPRHCCFSFSCFGSVSERAPRRSDTPRVFLSTNKIHFLFLISLVPSGCDSR